jgi:DNA polymerase III delta' subunit
MGFDTFIGNAKVVARIRSKLREDRFPHALIFSGPEGIGKRTCALMLAKALNCRNAQPDDFCDECPQCRKINTGIHPDVAQVSVLENASEIKVEQIREVLQTLNLQPLEGRTKVYIIDPATRINRFAANALLKSLEEPPENSLFVLLVDNLVDVTPTVRSRSQSYTFTPLSREELRHFESEDLALRWAQGSIGRLKSIDLDWIKERREAVLSFIEMAAKASPNEFAAVMSSTAALARAKEDFGDNLRMITVLLADILYLREGLPDKIVNVDLEKRLAALGEQLQTEKLISLGEFLGVMERYAKNYVNKQLLADVFALTANASVDKIAHDNAAKSR